MSKLKKSTLKQHLVDSTRILKRSLTYAQYCYLILAVLFVNHVGEASEHYSGMFTLHQVLAVQLTAPFHPDSSKRKKKYTREELSEMFSTLESTDPSLKGVLLPAITDVPIPESDWLGYQDQLDKLQQTTSVFSNRERFGYAYDYWISQLAGMTNKRGVSFYTQRPLARLLVSLTKPQEGMSIYDPTAGTGGLLLAAADYIQQQGGSVGTTKFFGREKSPSIWAIGKMNLWVHQLENVIIEQGDTLQSSRIQPDTFDVVLQNLPLPSEPDNKAQSRRINVAFLQHAIDVLSPRGRAAILSPVSVLQHEYQTFWQSILSRDWLEAVITLPAGVLVGTRASACVIVFNKNKPAERHAQVLFIQYPSAVEPGRSLTELRDENLQPIIKAFENWGADAEYGRVITTSEIEEHSYSLNIERYPEWSERKQSFDIGDTLYRYRTAVQKRDAAITRLLSTLENLNDRIRTSYDGKAPE